MTQQSGAKFKTVSEVRTANIAHGGRFFSRGNMRAAGDTLKSFALWRDPQGELFLYRKPEATVNTPRLQGVEPSKIQVGFNHNLGTLWRVESSGRLVPVGTEAKREFYLRLKEKS